MFIVFKAPCNTSLHVLKNYLHARFKHFNIVGCGVYNCLIHNIAVHEVIPFLVFLTVSKVAFIADKIFFFKIQYFIKLSPIEFIAAHGMMYVHMEWYKDSINAVRNTAGFFKSR